MYRKCFKIILILIIVCLLISKYCMKYINLDNPTDLEKTDKLDDITNLKELELSDDKTESETDINSEEIEGMFNMENFNEDTENKKTDNKEFAYLDIEYMNNRGRIVLNLNDDIVPKTVKNFSELCKKKAYVNSTFHRVINNFMIQGGDFTKFDGTGSLSIYGNKFPDENFSLKNKKGAIVMANSGPDTNGSQFYILTNDAPWLDGKHVVFGNVVKGMDLVDFIGGIETNNNDKPVNDVKIVDCGML